MSSRIISLNAPAIEKQIKNRIKVEKYMNGIRALLRVASIAAEQEFIDIDIQTIRDYIHTLNRLAYLTQKMNGKGLDILVDENAASKKDFDYLKSAHQKAEIEKTEKEIKFTSREIECIEQLLKGKNKLAIGEDLNISKNTVDFHAVRAIKKLISLTSLGV